MSLNPHVVGRFFRALNVTKEIFEQWVLIPMWWGGFSESTWNLPKKQSAVLIPMWWGGFSEPR